MSDTVYTIHKSYTGSLGWETIVSERKTTIRVAESTKERLKERGEMGMSYDDALITVLDRLEELENKVDDE